MSDDAFWQRRIRRTRAVVNLGWLLEALAPVALIATLLLVAFVLAARRGGFSGTTVFAVCGGLAAAALMAGFLRARRRFVSAEQTRALLDYSLTLENRLTAASAGVGGWPASDRWSGPWQWNMRRLLPPLLGCAALIAAAFLIPIPAAKQLQPPPSIKPPALAEAEQWIDALAQTPAVDPESLEPAREQAEELAQGKPEDWYSHSNLEAADHLRAQLEAGMQQFDAAAAKLDALLGALGEKPSELAAQPGEWKTQLASALGALDAGLPRLDPALAQQLRNIDPGKLRQLTPEQLRELQKRLKEGRGVCKECLGGGEPEALIAGFGAVPGNGGITRGPGTAPLTLSADPSEIPGAKMEPVANEDLSRAALGDVLGTSTGEHELDRTALRAVAGGAAASVGTGADAVWIPQNLTPAEQQRVRTFFK